MRLGTSGGAAAAGPSTASQASDQQQISSSATTTSQPLNEVTNDQINKPATTNNSSVNSKSPVSMSMTTTPATITSSAANISPAATTTTPINNTSTKCSDTPEKISFHLKTSIFTRRITIDSDKMALGLIKQLAIAFLQEIYFQQQYPANTYIGDYIRKHYNNLENFNSLYDRIILRKYNSSERTFSPFNSVADIEPDSYISIEISEKLPSTTHLLSSSSSNIINNSMLHTNNHYNSSTVSSSCTRPSTSNFDVKMSHEFHQETYLLPTHCAFCSTLIKGIYKQGFQCNHCKKNYCPKCKVKADTTGEGCLVPAPQNASPANLSSSNLSFQTTTTTASSSSSSSSSTTHPNYMSSAILSSSTTTTGHLFTPSGTCHSISQTPTSGNNDNLDSGTSSIGSSSANVIGDNVNKLESNNNCNINHSNMSKRKSASNLLHFNIANPFKSHHNNQQPSQQQASHNHQQQQTSQNTCHTQPREDRSAISSLKSSLRGSSGALDPVLQQLSRQLRDQHQQQLQNQQNNQANIEQQTKKIDQQVEHQENAMTTAKPNMLAVHGAQLSSSHQNLYTISDREGDNKVLLADASGSSSVHQSPSKQVVGQLSNSARTSARDLLHSTSPIRRDQASNHTLISLDWIQLSGNPTCVVCTKSIGQQPSHHQQPPSMCRVCKALVHYQCKDLVAADCLTRVTESSRAAASATESNNQESNNNNNEVKGTNSNLSRDNIRLHRLAPSVRHVRRPNATKPIIEGWLQHKTLSDEQSRRHYWRLDNNDITLYDDDTSTRYFKAIALSKITQVISANSLPKLIREDVLLSNSKTKSATNSPTRSPEFKNQMGAMFGFKVATGSVYLVQASDPIEAERWKGSLENITKSAAAVESAKLKKSQDNDNEKMSSQQQQRTDNQENNLINNYEQSKQQSQIKAETDNVPQANDNDTKRIDDTTPTVRATTDAKSDQVVTGDQPKQLRPAPGQRHHHHHHHHHHYTNYRGHRGYTNIDRPSRLYNKPRIQIRLDPMKVPDHWIREIEDKYLIEPNRVKGVGYEELGSGQFGKVYAAISEYKLENQSQGIWSGVPVAIKEISKARFDLHQQEKLRNEADILSRLDHPGVIILERVHDLTDKIYIVMEQLEDDMLEMIVSTPEKRLSERVTKFLTYQILEALRYLHAKNIAHCDLKPENVLLVERRSQFPQIKLCDFGFAKIIESNSFRSSLVGTPAYLAPEVVKGQRYNLSVDVWSVGVIVYVSLSGEFPFNEGENIHDQISRANFMYPDQPWSKISKAATDFIDSLLRVNQSKRLTASQAQSDKWLNDFDTWCDLCELEYRVGRRWLTAASDFDRWTEYARKNNKQVPRSVVLLHEQSKD